MKILKTAQHKWFRVDTEVYTQEQIEQLLETKSIFEFFDHYAVVADECKSISVEYNKAYGLYCNVATHNNGTKVFVTL